MKKRNMALILVLVAIAIVSFMNFDKIKFLFSMVDIYITENKEVEEETNPTVPVNPLDQFNLDELAGEDENKDPSGLNSPEEDMKAEDENSVKAPMEENKDKTEKNPTNKDPAKLNNKRDDNSLESIAIEYNSKFKSLQDEFLSSLDGLVAKAASEYLDESSSSTQIASKYISQASSLEKSCDVKMDSMLKDLKLELDKNGYETSLVADIKDYYRSFKKNKKTDFLNTAKKHL